MVNYQESKIYKIVNDVNNIIYIGSTTAALSRRMAEHRCSAKTKCTPIYIAMREIGIEHFKILLIKPFLCNNKAELEAEEYKIMKECDVELYNEFIGHHSKKTKEKMIDKSWLKGKVQEEHNTFKYGNLRYNAKENKYNFSWQENGKQHCSSIGCGKRGMYNALLMAYDKRKSIYPEWRTPEEEVVSDLSNLGDLYVNDHLR